MDYQKKYLKYKQKYLELKNQIGGFQTLDEIIAELKRKNKYDEWVAKGSKFGRITKNIFPSIYYYTTMYDYQMPVNVISNVYKEGSDNIPIFDLILKRDGLNVIQYQNDIQSENVDEETKRRNQKTHI